MITDRLQQIRELIRDALIVGDGDVLAIALHSLDIEFPDARLSNPADQSLSAGLPSEWEGSKTAQNPEARTASDLEAAGGRFSSKENGISQPDSTARCRQ
jgi:hypothetical protein